MPIEISKCNLVFGMALDVVLPPEYTVLRQKDGWLMARKGNRQYFVATHPLRLYPAREVVRILCDTEHPVILEPTTPNTKGATTVSKKTVEAILETEAK